MLDTEFLQLNDMGTFLAIYSKDLTKQQKKKSLIAMSLIKEKSDGSLKGRTCAFGKTQRGLYEKHETFAPTVHTDSFMATTAIETKEGRYVVKGAFLHAPEKDFTVMRFVNEQVETSCNVNEEHVDYVTTEGKNKILYLMLSKALYGT